MANLDGLVVSLRSSHARTGSADTPVPDGTRPRAWRRRRRLRVVHPGSDPRTGTDACSATRATAPRGCWACADPGDGKRRRECRSRLRSRTVEPCLGRFAIQFRVVERSRFQTCCCPFAGSCARFRARGDDKIPGGRRFASDRKGLARAVPSSGLMTREPGSIAESPGLLRVVPDRVAGRRARRGSGFPASRRPARGSPRRT